LIRSGGHRVRLFRDLGDRFAQLVGKAGKGFGGRGEFVGDRGHHPLALAHVGDIGPTHDEATRDAVDRKVGMCATAADRRRHRDGHGVGTAKGFAAGEGVAQRHQHRLTVVRLSAFGQLMCRHIAKDDPSVGVSDDDALRCLVEDLEEIEPRELGAAGAERRAVT